jgi:c-di-GMP-binding flagellar brake protein YcgR
MLNNNKRLFPRIEVDIRVGFEFVKWNETALDHCANSYEASITDISAKGAGLRDVPDFNSSHLKKLSSGKNKIRLNFLLSEDDNQINTFARLVWSQLPEEEGAGTQQYGFEFIDIPGSAFERIKRFIDSASN